MKGLLKWILMGLIINNDFRKDMKKVFSYFLDLVFFYFILYRIMKNLDSRMDRIIRMYVMYKYLGGIWNLIFFFCVKKDLMFFLFLFLFLVFFCYFDFLNIIDIVRIIGNVMIIFINDM